MSKNLYLPSKTPGKTWQLGTGKSSRGQGTGHAYEGVSATVNGFETFTFEIFGARSVVVTLDTRRATDKAKADALAAIRAKLAADDLLGEGA